MQTVSELYKKLLAVKHKVETKLVIEDNEIPEEKIRSMTRSGKLFSGNTPTVGCCVAAQLNLEIEKPSFTVPRNAALKPYVRLTNGDESSEWIPKGVFYIDTRRTKKGVGNKETLVIQAYDAMLKAEQDYPTSTLEWPNYDVNVAQEICDFLGIEIDFRTLDLLNAGMNKVQYPGGYSCRETLGYIAAMNNGNFIMSDTGKLLLVQLGALPDAGMTNTTDIERRMRSFSSSEPLVAYDRAEVIVDENTSYSYPTTSTGRTLTVECPWGRPYTASMIWWRIKGFQYQPFRAEQAILDPAAELGDGISANGIYSGIYTMDLTFGPGFRATVSAPFEEELDHEYPYVSKQDRKINRKLGAFSSELKVQASQISAKVSRTGGSETEDSSFGWDLTDNSWIIKANGSTVLNASPTGLEVYGRIQATSGIIGGFTIEDGYLSTRSQTWGGEDPLGIYIGPSGIQIGTLFKVDRTGTLYATDGHFTGTVYAGMIEWGDDAGYFSGEGLYSGTIYGNRLVGNTITTAYTSTGINAALENGNWAANLFSGIADYDASIRIGTVSCTTLFKEGYGFYRQSVDVKGSDGSTVTIPYWGWVA